MSYSKIRAYELSGYFWKSYKLSGTFYCDCLEYDILSATEETKSLTIKVEAINFRNSHTKDEAKNFEEIENYFNKKNVFFIVELDSDKECIFLFERFKTKKNKNSLIIDVSINKHPNEALIKLYFQKLNFLEIKENLIEKINAIESDIRDLKSDVDDYKSERYDINYNIRDLKSDVDNLKDRLNNL